MALQLLYEYDATGDLSSERIHSYLLERTDDGDAREYGQRLVSGVKQRRDEFDGIIERLAEHWAVSRMPVVDRNILRMGTFELLASREVPVKVVINEAVELAKKFGSADSGRFINAILDRVRREYAERETDENGE
jgi:N utilization substance protein B